MFSVRNELKSLTYRSLDSVLHVEVQNAITWTTYAYMHALFNGSSAQSAVRHHCYITWLFLKEMLHLCQKKLHHLWCWVQHWYLHITWKHISLQCHMILRSWFCAQESFFYQCWKQLFCLKRVLAYHPSSIYSCIKSYHVQWDFS